MVAHILRRLMEAMLILIGITMITYILLYLVPADPVRQIAGRSATSETVENIRRQLGLHLPVYHQYWNYFTALIQGDFGRSYIQKTEVAELIRSRLPASLLLMVAAIAAELAMGLMMGILSAVKRNKPVDNILMVISFVGVSAPQFVVGIILLYVFAVKLGWFPIGGLLVIFLLN